MYGVIGKVVTGIETAERFILTLFLGSMIILAVYQILLRWFTSGGLVWIDPLLRYLVLWSGLIGAVYATSKDKHIAINITDYVLPESAKNWLHFITSCLSAVVAGFLCRASVLFIQSEMEFGGTGLFDISSWLWSMIFPVAFALILSHFVLNSILATEKMLRKKPSSRGK